MVVSVDDVVLFPVLVVKFVSVALVCVQINDTESLKPVPFLKVVSDESDIWIDTEAAT